METKNGLHDAVFIVDKMVFHNMVANIISIILGIFIL